MEIFFCDGAMDRRLSDHRRPSSKKVTNLLPLVTSAAGQRESDSPGMELGAARMPAWRVTHCTTAATTLDEGVFGAYKVIKIKLKRSASPDLCIPSV